MTNLSKTGCRRICAALLALACGASAGAATTGALATEVVVADVKVPWGMVWLPDGDMLVTERRGELLRVREGKVVASVSGLPDVHVKGQGGLLDIELHPDHASNSWLYLTYSSPEGQGNGSNTALLRARLSGNRLTDQQVLYKATPNTNRGQHYGSRIEFDAEGFLYFSVGDRGNRDQNPQDVTRDGGKVYRLNDDGSVPADNPFADQAGAGAAVFSYGHRNPQGMARHPVTGKIWVHEHGPRGGDELNLVQRGANYGWPLLSFGINYSGTSFAEGTTRAGFADPAWYWDPSIAPSGMTFVTSSRYPDWQGKLLVGSLKFSYLVLVTLENDKATQADIVLEGLGRVRNVRQAPDGYLYVATEGGGIKRVLPQTGDR